MNSTFRPAIAADIDTILEFSRALNVEDPSFTGQVHFDEPAVRTALVQLLQNPSLGRVWLVYASDRPIGYVVLTLGFSLEYHGLDAFIDEIYLAPTYRGQGIGKQVLAFVENEARRLGVKALHLEVERHNQRARSLYRRLGFSDQERFLLNKWLK